MQLIRISSQVSKLTDVPINSRGNRETASPGPLIDNNSRHLLPRKISFAFSRLRPSSRSRELSDDVIKWNQAHEAFSLSLSFSLSARPNSQASARCVPCGFFARRVRRSRITIGSSLSSVRSLGSRKRTASRRNGGGAWWCWDRDMQSATWITRMGERTLSEAALSRVHARNADKQHADYFRSITSGYCLDNAPARAYRHNTRVAFNRDHWGIVCG